MDVCFVGLAKVYAQNYVIFVCKFVMNIWYQIPKI